MAKINYNFYSGKDIYNDGTVEDDLISYYRDNKKINFDRPEVFYLTTEIRENILNWYPFTKNDDILEIGCGVGTITGMLCSKANKVVAVESSKRRSEVCFYRNQTYDNLEIYACDFKKFETKEKFDYIVMIGVFEYSKIFSESDNPFEYFLEGLKKMLKPNGKILIAIENRYGIKYWAGNNEDHIGAPFEGLYGYNNQKVQTFGKEELIKLLEKCGINNYKFYYVFPDYKMPDKIYTEKRLPSKIECLDLPIYNHGNENYNFDPRKTLAGIIENGQFGFFANSFLIEMSLTKNTKLSEIAYIKNQLYRNKEYQIITYLKGNNYYKKAKYECGNNHLDNIFYNYQKIKELNINICDIQKEDNELKIEIIKGKTLSEIINNLAEKNDRKEILKWFDNFYNYLLSISIKKGNKYILKYGMLDLHMDNLIVNENKEFILIDQEWCTNEDVPVKYPLWISILEIYRKIKNMSEIISMQTIMKRYQITEEMTKKFTILGTNFFEKEKNFKDNKLHQHLLDHSTIDINSKFNKIINNLEEEIKKLRTNNEELINQNNCLKTNNEELINHNNCLRKDISKLNTDINSILNSKRYRLISKIANIKNKIR